ncbi:MAG: hypothetical protein HC919_09035 [Oscillatoriales cyanobacterium SM2_2_1]|nr:hypothetical protein [Oscillatoriales cyanobacterium SM2_2_1]
MLPFAEVIASATSEFTAQCLEPDTLRFPYVPPFGSWVKTLPAEDNPVTLYGVVAHVVTVPIDSIHRAVALGLSLDELRLQQPQIFAMLKTEVRVALVGFGDRTHQYQHLPARPPQMHQAVYGCDPQEIVEFTEDLHFLRTLLHVNGAPVDELVAAVLRDVYQIRQCDRPWLVAAGRKLSLFLKEDYDRLSAIMAQIHP